MCQRENKQEGGELKFCFGYGEEEKCAREKIDQKRKTKIMLWVWGISEKRRENKKFEIFGTEEKRNLYREKDNEKVQLGMGKMGL